MSNQIREVRPMDKLSSRLHELQKAAASAVIVAGRGIRVTQGPNGVIVEADAAMDDGSTAADSTTNIPRWG